MIVRILHEHILQRIDYQKVIIIFGPRQTGKTTLVKQIAEDLDGSALYFNADELATRNIWQNGQIELLKQSIAGKKVVVVDEAQMIPEIGIICKQLADSELGVQIILTGSSAFNMANATQEPLTGRKWEYRLYPVSFEELVRHEGLPGCLKKLPLYLTYGTYPEIVTHATDARQLLANLASSYLYKDILALTDIRRPSLLEKILKALAWQTGSEVSLSELSRTVGADVKTVDHYIYLLEQVFVLYRLGAFSRNLRNEINTRKKIYFYDNGIRNALIGNFSGPDEREDIGALWENFLLTERKKLLDYNGFYGSIYFWRNNLQAEIDYIEEIDGKLFAFEFKWNSKAKVRFPKAFTEAYNPVQTMVIHRDNYWEWLRDYPY